MTWYITKRIGYCIFIIAGVVMLTFLLFNVAAGDPAAAVLGKNPSPQEIEDLREMAQFRGIFAVQCRHGESARRSGDLRNSGGKKWENDFKIRRELHTDA